MSLVVLLGVDGTDYLGIPLGVVTDSQVPDQVLGSFGSPLDGLELDVSGTSTLLSPPLLLLGLSVWPTDLCIQA